MSEFSSNRETNPNQLHSYEIIDMPPEVINNTDDESIFDLVLTELHNRSLYKISLVFTGFDGSRINASGFAGRTGTYGWTEATIREAFTEGRGERTPISYMADEIAFSPAIAVFDPDKLKGGLTTHDAHMDEFDPEELLTPFRDLRYWRTRDGSPLDSAAVAVFIFRT